MFWTIIGIILIIISCILIWNYSKKIKNIISKDIQTEKENFLIAKENSSLKQQKEQLQNELNQLNAIQDNFDTLAKKAFSSYCEELDKEYQEKEADYDYLLERLQKSYEEEQSSLLKDLDILRKELQKIAETRAAAVEAQLKEQEIKEQKEFYSLKISGADLNDAKVLRNIESKLNNPRVLRMLIWQSFYQKPMTQLCNNILGPSTVSGVYKITNQLTDTYYIGQAVDIATRWKTHAKCGLGIDTPVSNKLYQNMQEYGLENFTFEVLEKCPSSELNAKEKFYIDLYQADKYGLNSKSGNK